METLVHLGQKVNQMYDAFNRRDLNFILDCLSTDCIWEVMGEPELPFSGIYHGPSDVQNFFSKMGDTIDITDLTCEHILENGNIVLASGNFNATARNTNKRFSSFWCMTWEFNDDEQVVHFRDSFDTLACARALTER